MKKLPASLLVGLAMFVVYIAGNALLTFVDSYYVGVRWIVASRGLDLVMHTLIAVGMLELARSTRKPAMRVAAWLFAIAVAWLWTRSLIELGWSRTSWYYAVMGCGFQVMGLVMTASALAFVVAADGVKRAPVASVCAILAVLGYGWMPFVGAPFHVWLAEHRGIAAIYWLVQGGLFVGGTATLARLVAPDEAVIDPRGAASGLRILERAIKLRVVLAFVISAGALRKISSELSLAASVVLVSTLVIASLGCMRLARANLVGLRSLHAVIGGALVMWWAACQLAQLTLSDFPAEFADAWRTAGPIVGLAGFTLVGICVREALPALREPVTSRLVVFVMLSIIALAIVNGSYEAPHPLMILAGIASFTGFLAFASLARKAADAIGNTDVPEARVVSTSQP
jgi:hypothetical protein